MRSRKITAATAQEVRAAPWSTYCYYGITNMP
jgi:hypothetical protein